MKFQPNNNIWVSTIQIQKKEISFPIFLKVMAVELISVPKDSLLYLS